MRGASGSGSTSDAVNIIALGTRKGVYDGLSDFAQANNASGGGIAGGSGGIMNASFGGQASGGVGGGSGGLRGDGSGGLRGGGAGGGRFMDALARIESGNQNIFSKVDPDVAGPGTRSQGYFQINTPTWRAFASKAGVNLAQYPNAMSAPRDVQEKVASAIPLGRFGPRTQRMLTSEFGPLDVHRPVGQLGPQTSAESVNAIKQTLAGITDISKESTYSRRGELLKDLKGFVWHHTGGGGTPEGVMRTLNQRGLGVQYVMDRQGNIFRTLPPGSRSAQILPSEHGEGLSNENVEGMEVIAKNNADVTKTQIEAVKNFWRQYHALHPGVVPYGHGELNPSHKEGDEGKAQVDAIRAMHLDATGKTAALHGEALRKHFGYHSPRDRGQEVRNEGGQLMRTAQQAGLVSHKHSVTGDASLKVTLDKGLAASGGVKTKGDLFRDVKLDRAPVPYADTAA